MPTQPAIAIHPGFRPTLAGIRESRGRAPIMGNAGLSRSAILGGDRRADWKNASPSANMGRQLLLGAYPNTVLITGVGRGIVTVHRFPRIAIALTRE
jgi:hypothetical protein